MPDGRSLNFDRVAERYDATRGGELRGDQIGADLAALLDPSRPVLEVGVGTGVIALALQKRGFAVRGVDLSAQMLSRAIERVGPCVVQGDAGMLPFKDGSIDQVVCVWVLHVVADAAETMKEIARVIRPGGTCLVVDGKVVFDPDDPIDAAFREIEIRSGVDRPVGRTELHAATARDAGFEVVEVVESGPHPHTRAVIDAVSNFETRAHSWMWEIPEDVWERVSAPVIAGLRARPDLHERKPAEGWQEILVLRRPA